MDREIKFRAWIERQKEMVNIDVLAISGCTWGCETGKQGVSLAAQPHIPVMQYANFKDKKEAEVYDGDIIMFYYWSTYEQRSFPEYIDFRETEMKEGVGVVYWNETELSWYVRPIEGITVYHRSERPVQLDEMPLVYAGLTMEAISNWVGEYDASEEDLKQYTGRDGIEVIGNIYQNPRNINQPTPT